MHRIRLIHWNEQEAKERAVRIQSGGFETQWSLPSGTDFFRRLNQAPPDAVVIDLSRLPSQGRDAALAIWQYKNMRRLPVVFVGGDPEKVGRIKSLLPEALYTEWDNVVETLRHAIDHPPKNSDVPKSRLAGYAGAPLAKKLGLKPGSVAVLINAPADFVKSIRGLKENVAIGKNADGTQNLIIWFIQSRRTLEKGIHSMADRIQKGGLWIVWPKKISDMGSDLTQQFMRDAGLGSGLVDYKICSIDAVWSGLLFTRRKK